MIPKLSAPLIKDIRTGEGVLEWLLALLGVIAGATGNLSVAHTGLYLTILAVSKGLRRGLVKVVALQKGAGIGAPLEPALLQSTTGYIAGAAGVAGALGAGVLPGSVEHALSEISAAEAQAAAAQSAPGTPAEHVLSGLAPEPAQGLGSLPQSSPAGGVAPTTGSA